MAEPDRKKLWYVLGLSECILCIFLMKTSRIPSWKSKVKTGYLYSGTVSLTTTGGCRLFCSALPVRSAWLLLICHPQKSVTGWVGPSRSAHAMPWLLARQSTAPTMEYCAVIQRAQCWWATTCGCRDEESNPAPPGSETSALPLGHSLSPYIIIAELDSNF